MSERIPETTVPIPGRPEGAITYVEVLQLAGSLATEGRVSDALVVGCLWQEIERLRAELKEKP